MSILQKSLGQMSKSKDVVLQTHCPKSIEMPMEEDVSRKCILVYFDSRKKGKNFFDSFDPVAMQCVCWLELFAIYSNKAKQSQQFYLYIRTLNPKKTSEKLDQNLAGELPN